jgi:hypothetical protein
MNVAPNEGAQDGVAVQGRGWPVRIVATRPAEAENVLRRALADLGGDLEWCGDCELVAWVTAVGPLSATSRLCGALDAADAGWHARMRVLERHRGTTLAAPLDGHGGGARARARAAAPRQAR